MRHIFHAMIRVVSWGEDSQGQTPGIIGRALADEADRLEGLRARAWLVFALAIVIGSIAASIVTPLPGASVFVAISLALTAWFLFVNALVKRGKHTKVVGYITVVIGSPADPMAGWGMPLIFAGTLALGSLKLNPRYLVASGVYGGLQYVVLWYALIGPDAVPPFANELRPGAQFARATYFAVGGV